MVLRCVKIAISVAYHLFLHPAVRILAGRNSPFCMVLCYHSVSENELPNFTRQLDFLSKKMHPVRIGAPITDKTKRHVMITFDDAFESVIDRCAPELEKRNIPFTVFIPAGCLGTHPEWLRNSGHRDRTEKVATMEKLLTVSQNRIMLADHGLNHLHLPRLDPAELRREISGSKRKLEGLTGNTVDYFAFPYGEHDDTVVAACKEAGYRQVFSLEFETPYRDPEAFVKGRICVSPSDWMIEFGLKSAGSYAWMALVANIKSGIRKKIRVAPLIPARAKGC